MPTWDAGLASGYILRLDVWLNSQDQANNRSNVGWHLHIIKGSGSGKWADGPHYWSVGNAISGSGSIGSYDFRNYSDLTLGSGSNWVYHDGDGNATPYFSGAFNDNDTWGELGDASTGGYWTLPRIPKVPGAPTNLWGTGNPDQIGPTSMRYRFSGTTDGGSTILEWQAQRATNSGFTTGLQTVTSNGTTVFTGLNPETTYYFRARGRNAVGWGPYGAVVSGTTLSTTPPTLAVVPNPTGLTATLTITPPASLPNPDSFVVERRVVGTTTPVTTLAVPSSPYTATGLTAGVSYEWRAAMVSGSYTSDFSGWVMATQPSPNTNPGDYFDGATPAKSDTTYVWDGTANNSTSRAVGKTPAGWAVDASASGGTAVIMRQTGGRSQTFSARVIFMTDALTPGFKAGQAIAATGRSDAAAGGRYWGSIYVQIPSRSQRMAAVIDWLDGAGTLISTSAAGDAVVVPDGIEDWVRLSVKATAPAGTVFGAVRSIDVAGTGWSAWKGGDVFHVDDAMFNIGEIYPYFDGNSVDPNYVFAWLGAANASVSTRTAAPLSATDPFTDPDCPPPPLPPRPPVIVDDCIVEVGTWRRYWASIPAQYVLNWLAELPTITLNTSANPERQIRIRIYENPDALSPDDFVAQNWVSEQIISFMPAGSQYVLNGVDQNMMGSTDGGNSWTNLNHLLYGTGSTPASWPVLRCGSGYLISFDVPLEAPAGNLSIDVALTRRY